MIFCPQRYNTKRRLSSVFRNFLSGCQSKGCVFRFYNCLCELLIFDAVFRRKARISPVNAASATRSVERDLQRTPSCLRGRRTSISLRIATKKYYFCTVEQSRMNHDRTYRPVPYAPAPRLRDADGSMRPHTSGVRVCSCTSIATEPCRPTACAGEYPCCTFTHPATAHYSLLTANSTYTFSAKEKDSETGLSYFGSRYYSSDLSVWLSVDPMSDKYSSL